MLIYMITNKISGNRYIGQTVQRLEKRWCQHCNLTPNSKHRNMPIVRAIQKYGRENFEIKVLARCASIEEMNHREEYYIKIFNTLSPNGYNLDSGGKNRRTHQSTKDKLSKIHKGRPGKAPSQETRDKIAKANFGKKCSKKTRNKMSESRSGSNNPNFGGKSVTEKQRQALREYSTGRPSPRRKKVLCVTTGTVYPFLMEAAKVLGINFQAIARVCSGERPHTHGLIFKYI